MTIQSANAYSALSLLNISGYARQTAPLAAPASFTATPAFSADRATISQAARNLLAASQNTATSAGTETGNNQTAVFDTSQGALELDIEAYFTPPSGSGVDLNSVPLLMPSQKNIDALRQHLSSSMPEFLARHGIPSAPARITYDNQGKIQLPADYPYAEQFEQALEKEPAMARELSAVHAITSSWVEIQKSMPFQQEYAAASSQAEIDAILTKYRYLFSDNRPNDTIALNFSTSGQLTLTANDEPVS